MGARPSERGTSGVAAVISRRRRRRRAMSMLVEVEGIAVSLPVKPESEFGVVSCWCFGEKLGVARTPSNTFAARK